jgi:hypothetical protein
MMTTMAALLGGCLWRSGGGSGAAAALGIAIVGGLLLVSFSHSIRRRLFIWRLIGWPSDFSTWRPKHERPISADAC